MTTPPRHPTPQWDIFCQVIDNHGDIGVCWRLACNLADHGHSVRLWVDDGRALTWMAPDSHPRIEVRPWGSPLDLTNIDAGNVLVEAFGCEIAPEFIAIYQVNARARGQNCAWINLEYLSAEPYVIRSHGLPSPVMHGPGKGLVKHFFYPGFTPGTGGLLREPDLMTRQAHFDRHLWLADLGVAWQGQQLVSLFCYEPAALDGLLEHLANASHPTLLLVTQGRARDAVSACIAIKNTRQPSWNKAGVLSFFHLPHLTQIEYDHLLWACDVNFVRGEDSLVRALWAGKPMMWHIYPQDDNAHYAKLEAFLQWLDAPPWVNAFHRTWNNLPQSHHQPVSQTLPEHLTASDSPADPMAQWQTSMLDARARLLMQADLANQLIRFISKNN